MKGKHYFILLGCTLFIFCIMAVLYAVSSLSSETFRGDFERNFVNQPARPSASRKLDLKYPYYYIAGVYDNQIYLGNRMVPFYLLRTDFSLTDTQHIPVKVRALDAIKSSGASGRFYIAPDSPTFFVKLGVQATILKGTVGEWSADVCLPGTGNYYVEAVPLSASSFAMRSYRTLTGEYELAKCSTDSPYFKFNVGILEKQIDGLFCVEGMLHYSAKLNRIIYLYTYRNQYSVMDTMMNLVYRSNTIDPFSRARIQTAYIDSENISMLSAPPNRINERSCVSGEFLYVQSNVLDKSSSREVFEKSIIIDVYDLGVACGGYKFSFYVDNYLGRAVNDFLVTDNMIVCLHGTLLVVSELPDEVHAGTQ